MLSENAKMLKPSMMFNWEHNTISYDYEIVFFVFLTQIKNANSEKRIQNW